MPQLDFSIIFIIAFLTGLYGIVAFAVMFSAGYIEKIKCSFFFRYQVYLKVFSWNIGDICYFFIASSGNEWINNLKVQFYKKLLCLNFFFSLNNEKQKPPLVFIFRNFFFRYQFTKALCFEFFCISEVSKEKKNNVV